MFGAEESDEVEVVEEYAEKMACVKMVQRNSR